MRSNFIYKPMKMESYHFIVFLFVPFKDFGLFLTIAFVTTPERKEIVFCSKKLEFIIIHPFSLACCHTFVFKEVNVTKDIVEDTLTRYYSEETPLNIVDVLLTAAIDDKIHLNCLFFLLRR